MLNFAQWYYTLSFTFSLHFLWHWLFFFKVIAVSNGFNWLFFFWLRWNFVGLLSTSSMSWIYHYFWLPYIFKGVNWCVSWFYKDFIVGYFMETVEARFFNLCCITTLLGVYQFIPSLITLTSFQGHRYVRIITNMIFFLFCTWMWVVWVHAFLVSRSIHPVKFKLWLTFTSVNTIMKSVF